MNPLFDIKSIRYGQVHFNPWTWEQTNCGSKNKAKARSRVLGGAGNVIAAKSSQHLKDLQLMFKVENDRRMAELDRLAAEEKLKKEQQEKVNV